MSIRAMILKAWVSILLIFAASCATLTESEPLQPHVDFALRKDFREYVFKYAEETEENEVDKVLCDVVFDVVGYIRSKGLSLSDFYYCVLKPLMMTNHSEYLDFGSGSTLLAGGRSSIGGTVTFDTFCRMLAVALFVRPGVMWEITTTNYFIDSFELFLSLLRSEDPSESVLAFIASGNKEEFVAAALYVHRTLRVTLKRPFNLSYPSPKLRLVHVHENGRTLYSHKEVRGVVLVYKDRTLSPLFGIYRGGRR